VPDRDLTLPLRGAFATLSAGAAAIHLSLVQTHFAHHWTFGLSFLLAGLFQLVWAVLLWTRPTALVVAGGAVLQGLMVPVYLVVHTVGWPWGVGAHQPEANTVAGILCCLLELAIVAGVLTTTPWKPPVFRVRAPGLILPLTGAVVLGSLSATFALGGATEPAGHLHLAAAHTAGHATGHTVDHTPPTAAQRRAADRLLVASRASMARYPDVASAERAGYRVIHNAGNVLLHFGNPAYMRDGRTVDPQHMESLIYVRLPGRDLLVGGMFMVPKGQHGPAVGGSLTPWHAHDDLCLDPVKGIAITPTATGCPAGSAIGETGEMMHVWAIDYPGGPFAELDPLSLRTAVMQKLGLAPKS
jgi:hypothetical protein